MTKRKRDAFHYWRVILQNKNAYVACLLLIVYGCSPKDSLMRQKFDGILDMNDSCSWWERADEGVYLEGDFFFFGDSVSLPLIHHFSDTCFRVSIDASNLDFDSDEETREKIRAHARILKKRSQDSEGRWRVIGNRLDSILIDAPNHPLNGKYSVTFFIDREEEKMIGNCPNIYKIILDNDSTHIVCSKVETLILNPNLYKYWMKD